MKFKNTVIGLVCALGAMTAPLSTKAGIETNAAPQTVELSKDKKNTKLKEIIFKGLSQNKRLNELPENELVKYIDFPQWMPVTKDGQFDENKANKMFDAAGLNAPQIQQAFKEYKNSLKKGTEPNIAFQKFAEQVAGNDQEKAVQLKQLAKTLENMPTVTEEKGTRAVMAVGLLALGAIFATGGVLLMKENIKDESKRCDYGWNSQPSLGSEISTLIAMGLVVTGLATGALGGITGYTATKLDLRDVYQTTSKDLYRAHINHEVQKAVQPETVQKGTKQTKQMIEATKQKNLTK